MTFNNHNTSTKSYDHIREHNEAVSKPDFVPLGKEITAEYSEGESIDVSLHDGSILSLEKLSNDYNPLDKKSALENLIQSEKDGIVTTGLLYIDPKAKDLKETINMTDTPLNKLEDSNLCPGEKYISSLNDKLR